MESVLPKYRPGKEITLLELIEECELEQKMKDGEEESTSRDSEGKRKENSEVAEHNL
jgi:hypothetical protein